MVRLWRRLSDSMPLSGSFSVDAPLRCVPLLLLLLLCVQVWCVVLLCFILGLPMLHSYVAFAAITSIGVIGLYISYLGGWVGAGYRGLRLGPSPPCTLHSVCALPCAWPH